MVLPAALHEGCHHFQGQALQIAPNHMAAMSHQVREAAQHRTPYLRAALLTLQPGPMCQSHTMS